MKIKFYSGTAVMAWPTAEFAIMNPGGAEDLLRRLRMTLQKEET